MNAIRERYINGIREGNIIAFRSHDRMFSGKVVEANGSDELTVQTKNGSIFYVKKSEVAWVKNGSCWPDGIYNALKFTKKAMQRTQSN